MIGVEPLGFPSMSTVDRDRLERHWIGPVRRELPPISVVVGLLSYVTSVVWVKELEGAKPVLTIDLSPGLVTFGIVVLIGTLLGSRLAWALQVVSSALLLVGVLQEAIDIPRPSAA